MPITQEDAGGLTICRTGFAQALENPQITNRFYGTLISPMYLPEVSNLVFRFFLFCPLGLCIIVDIPWCMYTCVWSLTCLCRCRDRYRFSFCVNSANNNSKNLCILLITTAQEKRLEPQNDKPHSRNRDWRRSPSQSVTCRGFRAEVQFLKDMFRDFSGWKIDFQMITMQLRVHSK